MRILLVDDENLARDRLRRMLEKDTVHEVVGEAANGHQAVQLCDELVPDLVLLDIRMPGMDGLETARHFLQMQEPPAVIFCTAYEEHAIQAFDLQAVGYLLKPVRRENLLTSLEKTGRLNRAQIAALNDSEQGRRTHISARTHKGIELIPLTEVRCFVADQKYVTVCFGDGEVIIDETLRELETEFAELFIRVHRNALVAKNFVEGLNRHGNGQMGVRLRGMDEPIDISRRHLPAVRRVIKAL